MAQLSDDDLDGFLGYPDPPASIEDAIERIDQLELELRVIRDRLQFWMFWLGLGVIALLYKAFF